MWPNKCATRTKAIVFTTSRAIRTSTLLSHDTYYLFTQVTSERSFTMSGPDTRAAGTGLDNQSIATGPRAMAKAFMNPTDTIFISNSTFVIAEVL